MKENKQKLEKEVEALDGNIKHNEESYKKIEELIKKYNVHYGKIDFMLDEKENKFYKVINFNKDEVLDEIKFGMKYRFNFENKNSLIGEFIIFNKFDKTLLLVVKDDKAKIYTLNLDEIYDIK